MDEPRSKSPYVAGAIALIALAIALGFAYYRYRARIDVERRKEREENAAADIKKNSVPEDVIKNFIQRSASSSIPAPAPQGVIKALGGSTSGTPSSVGGSKPATPAPAPVPIPSDVLKALTSPK